MAGINLFSVLILLFNSDNPYALFSIGCHKELSNDITGAIEYYKKALILDPNAYEIYYALANAHYKINKLNEGIAFAKLGLEIAPTNLDLLSILAVGYIGKGELKNAIEIYKKALQFYPENLEVYYTISTLYEGLNDLKLAKEILLQIPEGIRNAATYIRLGTVSGKIGDHMGAIDYYRKAFSLDTTNSTALIGVGTGFDILGIKDSAIHYYEMALKYNTLLDISKRLVDLYMETDQFTKLIDIARQILKLDYYETNVRRSLGFALYKSKLFNEALTEFMIAATLKDDDSYSRFYIARIYLEQGRYDEAQKVITEAIKINPDFVELWVYLGFIGLDKRDYGLARYAFTEAAYRNADMTQVYYLLGVTAEMGNDYSNAYHYYKKSLTIDSISLTSLSALANLCDRINRKEEALRLFKRIINIDTTDATALNYVGYSYAERAESLEYALKLIEKALEIEPNNGYFIDSRGWVYYQQARYEEALIDLKRASELVEDPVILEHLGDVYIKVNEILKAKEVYEKVLKIDPKNKKVLEKLKQLKLLHGN